MDNFRIFGFRRTQHNTSNKSIKTSKPQMRRPWNKTWTLKCWNVQISRNIITSARVFIKRIEQLETSPLEFSLDYLQLKLSMDESRRASTLAKLSNETTAIRCVCKMYGHVIEYVRVNVRPLESKLVYGFPMPASKRLLCRCSVGSSSNWPRIYSQQFWYADITRNIILFRLLV